MHHSFRYVTVSVSCAVECNIDCFIATARDINRIMFLEPLVFLNFEDTHSHTNYINV